MGVIGFLTGIVAFLIDISVKHLFELKYTLLEKGTNICTHCTWNWSTLQFNIQSVWAKVGITFGPVHTWYEASVCSETKSFPIKVILRSEDDLLNLMKSERGRFVPIPKTQTVVVLKINDRNVKL